MDYLSAKQIKGKKGAKLNSSPTYRSKKLAKQSAAENALKSMVQHKNPVEAQVTEITFDIIGLNLVLHRQRWA